MTEPRLAENGRARRRAPGLILGGLLALAAVAAAHAAIPRKTPEPPAPVAAPAPEEEPVLIAFRHPLPGEKVNSPFGLRRLPWEDAGRLHEGVDIAAPPGKPVLAAADGVVTRAGYAAGYGQMVELTHAEGLVTRYGHLGRIDKGVRPGVALKAGAPLAKVGSSGVSSGPHLHFEIRDAGDRPLNPLFFLGRTFAEADDLPLESAGKVSPRVRLAYVSTIPDSKREIMIRKGLLSEAGD